MFPVVGDTPRVPPDAARLAWYPPAVRAKLATREAAARRKRAEAQATLTQIQVSPTTRLTSLAGGAAAVAAIGVDPAVFAALPLDVQDDVLADVRRTIEVRAEVAAHRALEQGHIDGRDPTGRRYRGGTMHGVGGDAYEKAQAARYARKPHLRCDMTSIRPVVKAWIDEQGSSVDDDDDGAKAAATLATFVCDFVRDGQLRKAVLILRYIKRLTLESHGGGGGHRKAAHLWAVVEGEAQAMAEALRGAPLAV